MEPALTRVSEYSHLKIYVSDDGESALVMSTRSTGRVYKVQFGRIKDAYSDSFDGNCTVLSGLICENHIAAAKYTGN